jgi:hypothetical protein
LGPAVRMMGQLFCDSCRKLERCIASCG